MSIPHDWVDESAFTPEFLEMCSDLELVALQHELREHREDRRFLNVVLEELQRRSSRASAQPVSADAVDPSASSTGTLTTRDKDLS